MASANFVLDYETRSPHNIEDVGVANYADSCEVMAIGYKLPYQEVKIHRVGYDPEPQDLYAHILTSKDLLWAHNAEFERWVTNRAVRKVCPNFPEVPRERWRCSRVLASYWGFPAKLEALAKAVGLQDLKDAAGNKAMLRCSAVDKITGKLREKPTPQDFQTIERLQAVLISLGYHIGTFGERCIACAEASGLKLVKDVKKRTAKAVEWFAKANGVSDPERLFWASDWATMFPYCGQDVKVQDLVVQSLLPAPQSLWDEWLVDCEINDKGVPVDPKLASNLNRWYERQVQIISDQLPSLTNGAVTEPTQREAILKWLNFRLPGVFADLTKDTLEDYLDSEEGKNGPQDVYKVVLSRLAGSKTSASKFAGYVARSQPNTDGSHRVYGVLTFHSAHTGRWSSRGLQLHNQPQGTFAIDPKKTGLSDKEAEARTGDLLVEIADCISKAKSVEEADHILQSTKPYSVTADPIADVTSWVRSCVLAPPGFVFTIADFAGIEGRGNAKLAVCGPLLEIFREGRDPYKELASDIYSKPASEISKSERKVGKYGILGLGYGMGWRKFRETVFKFERYNLDDNLCKHVVNTYRSKFSEIPAFWQACEIAAIRAVTNPGEVTQSGEVFWKLVSGPMNHSYLCCMLPSGRVINYVDPTVGRTDKFGGGYELRYWGIDSQTKQWVLHHTYGGKLVENIVQAYCRDLLSEAVSRAKTVGFEVPFHVHDEVIGLSRDVDRPASEARMLAVMRTLPRWAHGLPIDSSVFSSHRYRK
jgi:DNA polymerase